MKERKEVRNDIVNRVGHEHLVAIELDLVAGYLDIVLDLREIEDTGEVERIIHVQMDVEKRVLLHRIEVAVELHIVLLLEIGRFLSPKRFYLVDDIVLVGINVFSVLPLLFLSEHHRYRHELAIFVQQALDAALLCIFLLFVVDIEGNDSSSVLLVTSFHLIGRRAVARPFHGLRSFLP